MEKQISTEKLYDICIECLGCCGDYDVQIIEDSVWMIDLCEKITEHKDGSVSIRSAFLMTEEDFCYDEKEDLWWGFDSGTEYKLKIDKEGKIISKKKVKNRI